MTGTLLYCVITGAVSAVVFSLIMFFIGYAYRKKVAEKQIGSAEDEARRIINDAVKNGEARKKEALIEAKDEIHALRNEFDRDSKERRAEIQRQERRLQQKEENLDHKTENLERKEEKLQAQLKAAEEKTAEAEEIRKRQLEMLEKISGYTAEKAKAQLLSELDEELEHEKAKRLISYTERLNDEAEERAKDIISMAISRCSAEYTSESTVSVVPLPNDDMKGRIIGREGRNIRTIETMTGVDLIIDDTPEAITISSFDPVRREIARTALEKLVTDGRIHPTRIEETVEKARKEVEHKIKSEGERVCLELTIHGIHPELVKILGRLRYRTSYGQNVLRHSIEVSYIAGMMAAELGVDQQMAKRAGLLHDIGKALDHELDGSHIAIGVDVAKKYKEPYEVIHAIESHHGDVEPKTAIAFIVQAADAISASRPGARRENLESYIKRLEKLEEISNSFPGVEKSFAVQAGREVRIMVKPNEISDDKMVIVAAEIARKIESDLDYPGQIKVNMIRESRAVDYAK